MAANWLPDTPHPTPAPRQRAEAGAGKEHPRSHCSPGSRVRLAEFAGASCSLSSSLCLESSPHRPAQGRSSRIWGSAQMPPPRRTLPDLQTQRDPLPHAAVVYFPPCSKSPSKILTLARLLTCLFSVSPREAVSPGTGTLPVLSSAEAPRLVQDPTHSRCSINTVEWMVRGNQVCALSGDLQSNTGNFRFSEDMQVPYAAIPGG